MRTARLRLQGFRGFAEASLVPGEHVALIGEPRAGRSDIITGLRRVLEPRSTSARIDPLDVHRPAPMADQDEELPLTEVEVSLVDLGDGLKQLFDSRLEPLDPTTGEPATSATASTAVLGIRLCYRLRYDEHTGTGEHWVDFPHLGDAASATYVRASRQEREALPFIALHRSPALQLRAEGLLRGLAEDADSVGLASALETLSDDVSQATAEFSDTVAIRDQIAEVFGATRSTRG